MKNRFVFARLAFGILISLGQAPAALAQSSASRGKDTVAPLDLSTPEKTLQSFLDAFARLDMKAMGKCVSGATYSAKAEELETRYKGMHTPPGTAQLTMDSPETQYNGRTATVRFYLRIASSNGTLVPPKEKNEIVLTREGNDWKIVTPSQAEIANSQPNVMLSDNLVRKIAILVRYPQVGVVARDKARAMSSLSNVRQIAIGCLILGQDNDGVFRLTAATFQKSLLPYIKYKSIFTSPVDTPGTISYHFNPKLMGKSASQLSDPSQTVMIYEGAWQKPSFRYQGKAVVGYADGHCVLATPQELKQAIWNVTGSAPAKGNLKQTKE